MILNMHRALFVCCKCRIQSTGRNDLQRANEVGSQRIGHVYRQIAIDFNMSSIKLVRAQRWRVSATQRYASLPNLFLHVGKLRPRIAVCSQCQTVVVVIHLKEFARGLGKVSSAGGLFHLVRVGNGALFLAAAERTVECHYGTSGPENSSMARTD